MTERIREYDRKLQTISKESYPETNLLRQLEGIGPLTALTFVLTLEDPYRFERSRSVGAYLGLVPASDRSGDSDPQKRISKEGDEMLSVSSWWVVPTTHSRSLWLRLRPTAPRREDSLPRRQQRKEASGSGCSEEALGALAPPVDYRRGLRPALQHASTPRAGGGSLTKEAMEQRPTTEEVRTTATAATTLKRGELKWRMCHGFFCPNALRISRGECAMRTWSSSTRRDRSEDCSASNSRKDGSHPMHRAAEEVRLTESANRSIARRAF